MNRLSSAARQVLADVAYRPLKDFLIASTGLNYYADKDADLADLIAQRMAKRTIGDASSYLTLLQAGQAGQTELDALIEDLTIGETFFFRHREMFAALGDTVLPDLIARNQHTRQLRIWSAGCSTGAEAYSISILLKRELAALTAGWEVTIVGTDINREFLARAREARFEEWAFRSTPEELRRNCFTPVGSSWLLAPAYKECVSFQYHNLVTHPFPSLLNNLFAFDLILCRNVTIYFNVEIVRRIIERFHQCLVEGGWLLVGHAEPNVDLFRSFRTVNVAGAVLYQKARDATIAPAWVPSMPVQEWRTPAPTPAAPAWSPFVLPDLPGSFPGRSDAVRPADPAQTVAPVPLPAEQLIREALTAVRALADAGEWEKAARCCEDLLTKDKLNPLVYFYQALVLEQMGRHAETENALRRVIYLDRNFVLGHYYLGLLLQKKGRLDQAARSFRNVLQLIARIDPARVFPDGDGLTAAELKKLTEMHLQVLEGV